MNPVDTTVNSDDKLPLVSLVPVAPSGLIKLNKFALNDAPFTRCFIQFINGRFHAFRIPRFIDMEWSRSCPKYHPDEGAAINRRVITAIGIKSGRKGKCT